LQFQVWAECSLPAGHSAGNPSEMLALKVLGGATQTPIFRGPFKGIAACKDQQQRGWQI